MEQQAEKVPVLAEERFRRRKLRFLVRKTGTNHQQMAQEAFHRNG
jgi:hypothetical protein